MRQNVHLIDVLECFEMTGAKLAGALSVSLNTIGERDQGNVVCLMLHLAHRFAKK